MDEANDRLEQAYVAAVDRGLDPSAQERRRAAVLAAVAHDRAAAAAPKRRARSAWWAQAAAACVAASTILLVMHLKDEPGALEGSEPRSAPVAAPAGEVGAISPPTAAPTEATPLRAPAAAAPDAASRRPTPAAAERGPATRAPQGPAARPETFGAAHPEPEIDRPATSPNAAPVEGDALGRSEQGATAPPVQAAPEAAAKLQRQSAAPQAQRAADAPAAPAVTPAAKAAAQGARAGGAQGLIEAVRAGDLESLKRELATTPADAETDAQGRSALGWAVLRSDARAAALLTAAGADPRRPDSGGTTPVDDARRIADPAVMQVLGLR